MRRAVLLAVMLGATAPLLICTPWLVIEDIGGGGRVAAFPLKWGERFEICYIHSVDRKPVCEVFSLQRGKGIVLHETYFRMFGAGMGHWQGHGHIVGEGGWIKIKEIDEPVGRFLLRVGSRGVDHTLSVRGKKINLTEKAEGKLVELKMKTHPWILSLIRK
ncbi:MAG: hypothetical protein DRG50_00740 [Deltaproteobacteria bacterium]|nr:MAG: hypothetical protein DRG50_00740 [Deltaproteobacteria bacterium]